MIGRVCLDPLLVVKTVLKIFIFPPGIKSVFMLCFLKHSIPLAGDDQTNKNKQKIGVSGRLLPTEPVMI